jgi:cytochrome c biogenesis protein CcmG/thiol:disulfide interchange protein DsbE
MLMILVACGSPSGDPTDGPELPEIDGPGIREILAELDRPAVVNVWASWCLPCRSEAPLLAAAHDEIGGEVVFIGIDVEDDRPSAREFIAEFGLDFDHYFDPDRKIPAELGGVGVPITYFVAPGGEIVDIHSGILDEPTLAVMLDELRS